MTRVEEFVNKAVIVYKGTQDYERDEVARSLYRAALNDAQDWVRDKLIDSLKGSKNNGTRAHIYLPGGGVVVSVGVSVGDFAVRPPMFDNPCTFAGGESVFYDNAERYHFPYGHIDAFINKAIMSEAGNPIEALYSFLDKQLETLHGYASSLGCNDNVLSCAKLEANDVFDVLDIHRYEPVIRSFMSMLKNGR